MDGFYGGLLRLARTRRAPLWPAATWATPTILAAIWWCAARSRAASAAPSAARAGDRLYVSGRLGGSALGLAGHGGAARMARHLRPEPRIALGRFLPRLGATAAMDLSDGLSLDLRRLCLASGLQAEIGAPPVFPGASLAQALHGGEDYELLFTVPPRTRVPRALRKPPAHANWYHAERPAPGVGAARRASPWKPLGFDHFRNP